MAMEGIGGGELGLAGSWGKHGPGDRAGVSELGRVDLNAALPLTGCVALST